MADSIKKQIVAKILDNLAALKTAGVVRKIERKHDLFRNESVVPALHLIVGPEVKAQAENEGEDNRGYTMSFQVVLKLILESNRDLYEPADDAIAKIQEIMEAPGNQQLDGLANDVIYDGDEPFITELGKPDGGVVVKYWVTYRRYRGIPEQSY
jgi:hypothetical protein